MSRAVKHGSVDQSVTIRIIDSTDGTPETGVTSSTAGLALWYRRQGGAKSSITVSDLSALTDAHSDGGLLHISDGYYRLDIPDAAFASGADEVVIGGTATGMIVLGVTIPLVAYDPADAVRLGLTSLPNANAGTSSGLPLQSDIAAKNPFTINQTTIATLTNQQTFTLTAGSSTDSVYDRHLAVITDSSGTFKCVALISSYVGSSKQVTLTADAEATIAAGDNILILASKDRLSLVDTTTNNTDMLSLTAIGDEVDSALATYDPPTKAELDSGFAALNDISQTELRAQVDAALQAIYLDHLFATTYNPDSKPGVADSLLNEVFESDAGSPRFTTNALENAPSGASSSLAPLLVASMTVTTVTSQTELIVSGGSSDDDAYNGLLVVITDQTDSKQRSFTGVTDYAGATGTIYLKSAPAFTVAVGDKVEVVSVPHATPSIINAEVTNALNTYDPPTKAELDAGLAALNDVSKADVNTEVTNALNTYDPPTKAELDAGLAALNDLTAQEVADALKLAPSTGAGATGSAMELLNSIDADITTVKADITTVKADTGTDIPAQISGLNDVSKADVNAEVDTALTDFFTSSAKLVDDIWDEPLAGHTTAGSSGKAISDIDSNTGSALTAQQVRDAMKLAPSTGTPASGSVDDYLSSISSDASSLNDTKIPDTISLAAIADAVLDEDMAAHTSTPGTLGAMLNTTLNNATSAADTSSNIDNNLPDLLSLSNIKSQVTTALADIFLDKLFAAAYDPATPPGVASSLLRSLTENNSGVPRFTSNAVSNVPQASAIADAVWDEASSPHESSGTFGLVLKNILDNTSRTKSSKILLDTTVQTVTSQTVLVLASGSDINTSYDGSIAVLEDATQAGRVSVVPVSSWNATTSTITLSASPGFTVAAGDSIIVLSDRYSADASSALSLFFGSSSQLVDDIWNEDLSTYATSGTAGNSVSSTKSTVSSISSSVSSILSRIGAFAGSGTNTILGFFQSLMRSNVTAPSDAGGTFDPATDSLEAIRDRGDAAWTTGAGGGGGTGDATLAKQQEILDAIAALPTSTSISNAVWSATTRSLTDKAGFSLSLSERSAIASAVESAIANDSDGEATLTAIANAVSANLDIPASELQAIATQIRTELSVELARIDANITSMQPGVAGLTVSGGGVVDGNLSLKRGSKATLTFNSLPSITMSHVLLGIRDDSGRSMLKIVGTIVDPNTATFTITSKQSLDLFGTEAKFDLFEVDNYSSSDGTYDDANRIVTGDVNIEPLYLMLEEVI